MKLSNKITTALGLLLLAMSAGTIQAALIYVSLSDSTIVTYDISLGNATAVQNTRTVFATGSPLSSPEEMVFDAAGNLYTTNRNGNTITKITPEGVKSTFASGSASLLNKPIGLTIDAFGNLYVANENGPLITKITPGGVATTFANVGTYGLASDSAGNIYAAPGGVSLMKITPEGVQSTFATSNLSTPRGMSFGPGGNLFVANFGSNSIGKFTPGGAGSTYLTGTTPGPNDVGFDALGNLYVAGNGNPRVMEKYDPSGVFQFSWSLGGPRAQHLVIQGGYVDPTAVPEPGQLAACGVFLLAGGMYFFVRRRKLCKAE